jgi:hypothetical protein
MAQIGSVIANRTGNMNYWNTHWWADKNYSFSLHQDILIKNFLPFFYIYGFFFNSHPWQNRRWVFNLTQLPIRNKLFFSKFYRVIVLKNNLFETTNKLININYKFLYPLKIWILRYQKWLIIFWFFYKAFQKSNIFRKFKFLKRHLNPGVLKKNQVFFLLRYKHLVKFKNYFFDTF